MHRVKRTLDYEEFDFKNLGINVKLKNVNTNTNAGHIADITVNDLAKLHLPCIYGKVLKLNVEFRQTTYYSTKRKLINTLNTNYSTRGLVINTYEGWYLTRAGQKLIHQRDYN